MSDTKIINADGIQYEFTPGENGSTVVKNPDVKEPDFKVNRGTAKVIGPQQMVDTPDTPKTGHGYSMNGEHKTI